jgi:energy-coupling factor transport system ATP-binding protein
MLRLNNVCFRYPLGTEVLRNVSFEGSGGEVLLLLGHNGAGKSTLLKLFNGILKPTSGSVTVNGLDTRQHPTSTLAGQAAVTFQNPGDQIFAPTVQQEAEFGPTILRRSQQRELVDNALRLFQLESSRLSHPYDLPLSGRKLLTVACAAASGCPILAFDEPSAGLSLPERGLLTNAIKHLLNEQRLILVVSHDLDLFLPLASRVLIMESGALTYNGSPQTLISNEGILRKSRLRLPVITRLRKAVNLSPFSKD